MKRTAILYPLLLIIITAVGASVRLADLGRTPSGFYIDEASFGYNAYSILKTGRDEYGVRRPLYTASTGTGKNPVYLYATAASVAVFGLDEFSSRLPAAVFGAAAIFFICLLAAEITSRKEIGILSALFLSLTPVHIIQSRIAYELSSFTCFLALSFFVLFRGLKKPSLFPLAGLLLAVTLLTYASAIPFVFMMVPVFVFLYRKTIFAAPAKKYFIISMLIFLVFSGMQFVPYFKGKEQMKHFRSSVLVNPRNIPNERELMRDTHWPAKYFADSPVPVLFAAVFVRNYLLPFSPKYMFIDACVDRTHPLRYVGSPVGFGRFNSIFIVFFPFALFFILRRRAPSDVFLFIAFLAYPVGPALAYYDLPGREIAGQIVMPMLFAVAAVCLYESVAAAISRMKPLSARLRTAVLTVLVVAVSSLYFYNASSFVIYYFTKFSQESAYSFTAGFRQAITWAEANKDRYSGAIVTNTIPFSYIYLPFYLKTDPVEMQNNKARMEGYGRWGGKFGWYEVRDPNIGPVREPVLMIIGRWERPDLPEIKIPGMESGNFEIKVVEAKPE